LRKNYFHERVARIKPLVRKIRKFKLNLQKTIQNSGKQFYLLTEANIMYLVQMDIIMCGENLGKNFIKK
jgi:hypothetical protein